MSMTTSFLTVALHATRDDILAKEKAYLVVEVDNWEVKNEHVSST